MGAREAAATLSPGALVEIRKLTWPDRLKVRHPVQVLGTDEHGWWVGSPAGAQFVQGDGGIWVADVDSVACITEHTPWNAWFLAEPRRNLYLDIHQGGRWAENATAWVTVDLDLDVYGLGLLEIVDIEELELHTELYGYPDELVEAAWATAGEARRIAESGAEPYATVGWDWLARWQARR